MLSYSYTQFIINLMTNLDGKNLLHLGNRSWTPKACSIILKYLSLLFRLATPSLSIFFTESRKTKCFASFLAWFKVLGRCIESPVSFFLDFVVAEMYIIWTAELVFRRFTVGLLLARLVR